VLRRRKRPRPVGEARRMLTFDGTYSLGMIRARKLEHEITCRDLDGFFEHVWSVHPAVGASPEHDTPVEPVTVTEINDRHTMIEGSVAWSPRLARFPKSNFALAQAMLLHRLDRLIRERGIAVVRAGEPFFLGPLGLLLARLNRCPLVVRVNANFDFMYATGNFLGYPRLYRSRRLEKAVARFVLRRADLVAPGSQDNLRYALENGASRARSTIWPYGMWIDPLHFSTEPEQRPSVRRELGLEGQPFMILVGRLEAVKHPDDVVRALAAAKRTRPDLAAVLVGGGTMQPELERLARGLGVADDLRIVGYRDQPWLAAALSSADVVVSPLTGRALVEACLSATPVVAYDVEWQSELIRPGETGMLVPYRDVEGMADAVCALLKDPDLADRLGRRAREVTVKIMDRATLIANEQADYRRLLGEVSAPAPRRRPPVTARERLET
ncbi:MAG: glycosyltransferase family 4 protein, partial [Actinomycetota bacterium]|nr:glycosyltransferase family 4 protein [Actinomycetota bacterium]